MNVLSLFDGMSCGRLALERCGIGVTNYFSSEIDKYAIKVSDSNYPDNIKLGDVTRWREWDIDWSSIDLIMAGSPCQGFSFAGKQLAFDDPRSKLFLVFVEILENTLSLNPKVKFLLENVRMKQKFLDVISSKVNCEPIFIDSKSVSPQMRPRYYWFNWDSTPPPGTGSPVSEALGFKKGEIRPASITGRRIDPLTGKRRDCDKSLPIVQYLEVQEHDKSRCLTTVAKDTVFTTLNPGRYVAKGSEYFYPTPEMAEILQTVPVGYTSAVSPRQRLKMLGNGWTVDVICHILKDGGFA